MACEGRPTSNVALVDKALSNMFCIEHYDVAHRSSRTLIDKASENWEVFTKGFAK